MRGGDGRVGRSPGATILSEAGVLGSQLRASAAAAAAAVVAAAAAGERSRTVADRRSRASGWRREGRETNERGNRDCLNAGGLFSD
jgi:hypothetical protein